MQCCSNKLHTKISVRKAASNCGGSCGIVVCSAWRTLPRSWSANELSNRIWFVGTEVSHFYRSVLRQFERVACRGGIRRQTNHSCHYGLSFARYLYDRFYVQFGTFFVIKLSTVKNVLLNVRNRNHGRMIKPLKPPRFSQIILQIINDILRRNSQS